MEQNTKDIFVFIEQRNHIIQDVSFELLHEARALVAEIKHVSFDVVAVLVGHQVQDLSNTLIAYGADKVIVIDNQRMDHYSTQHYSNALCHVIETYQPDSFLIGASVLGRDLAPRVAARMNTGLTADATKIEIDPENENSTLLWITRPAFGGNLYGTIICPDTRPQMATIRPNVFEKGKSDASRTGDIISIEYTSDEQDQVAFLETVQKEIKGVNITKANLILAAGRGMAKTFDLVEKTAKELGAVVASSRALVDAGIAKKEIQVGQTGSTVRPSVYIACGISGAVQHTAGMDKSELIIAINTDANAPIFQVADIGFVGDAAIILPLIKEELKRIQRN